MSTLARRTREPADRFSYLVHHCEGEAAQAIRRCGVLEPEEGYAEALRILERRFGDPHIIATISIEQLTEGPTLKADDHKALITLADDIMICSATLKQLEYPNDFNSCRTIGAVAARLPSTMQNEWFALAAKSFKSKRDPTFDELAKFISDKANAAAAQQVYAVGRRAALTTQIGDDRSGQVRSPVKCAQYGSSHYLDRCPEFIKIPVVDRMARVDRLRVCYLCIKPYHQAKVCRSRHARGFQLCVGKHHLLLHRPSSSETENGPQLPEIASEGVHHSIADVPKSNISCAVVPAWIRGPEGDVVVNAFLDNGASATLIHSSLLPKLGLKGTPAPLIIKTINGECVTRSASVSFCTKLLGSEEVMQVHRAWVFDAMPCLNSLAPLLEQSQKWKHLKEIPLPELKPVDIGLLIGCDVPKAQWWTDTIKYTWKDGSPCLPANKGLALRGHFVLKGRLERAPIFRKLYCEKVEGYVSKGYAEIVSDSEQNKAGPSVWYLPHHGVFKEGDKSKVRVVFNCAAKTLNTSLNMQLLTGPDL
ncbi:hypothetical protein X801_08364, partial [Opisthorchis viverrini]